MGMTYLDTVCGLQEPYWVPIAVDHHFFQANGMLLSLLAVVMLPTSVPTAFAMELLPRQTVPSLNLCKVPSLPRGWMFVLVKFQNFMLACSWACPAPFGQQPSPGAAWWHLSMQPCANMATVDPVICSRSLKDMLKYKGIPLASVLQAKCNPLNCKFLTPAMQWGFYPPRLES